MKQLSSRGYWVRLVSGGFLVLFWVMGLRADQTFAVLETRTAVYSNVTVTLKTDREIHIRHDGGVGNVGLYELDSETLEALGYEVMEPGEAGEGGVMGALREWSQNMERSRLGGEGAAGIGFDQSVEVPPAVLGAFLLFLLMGHLFFSYCGKLICVKAGSDPGFMIWLPVLQIFPMLRAAGMSGWWFLGFLVPFVNLVAQILWSIKIVNARGKHVIWAILLVLPLLNLLAFLYLAFSGEGNSRPTYDTPAYA